MENLINANMLLLEKINTLEMSGEKINDQHRQIALLTYNVENLGAENESLRNSTAHLTLQLNDRNERIESINLQLSTIQGQMKVLQSDNMALRQETQIEKEKHKNEVEKKNGELQKQEEEIQNLLRKLKSMEEEYSELNENAHPLIHAKLIKRNHELESALGDKEAEFDELMNDFKEAKILSSNIERKQNVKIQTLESEKTSKEIFYKKTMETKIKILETRLKKGDMWKEKYKKLNQCFIEQERIAKELEAKLLQERSQSEKLKEKLTEKCQIFLRVLHANLQPLGSSQICETTNEMSFSAVNAIIPEDIFDKAIQETKAVSAHIQKQHLSNVNLVEETQSLTGELGRTKQELLVEKTSRGKSERQNQLFKKKITLLKQHLECAEKKLKEEAQNYENKCNSLSHQVTLSRKEACCRDELISNMAAQYNKELLSSTLKHEQMITQLESQSGQMLAMKNKTKELEQHVDELKHLLKESHQREEQTRDLLKDKQSSLDLTSQHLETTKLLLSTTHETSVFKQQNETTKMLLESAGKHMEVLRSRKQNDSARQCTQKKDKKCNSITIL